MDRTKTIIYSVLLSFAAYLFLGRLVAAKLSTLPLLNRFKILSPQAPIVINNREQVRVSDTSDVLDAANTAKFKLSAIAAADAKNGELSVTGAAVNLTTDGVFLAPVQAFPRTGASYYAVLSDGRTAAISSTVEDPATGLVFAKAAIGNVSVAPFGNSRSLQPGEKIVFMSSSTVRYSPRLQASYVAVSENDVAGAVFNADRPGRSFGAQATGALAPGAAVINTGGEVVGIWNGEAIISSDVLRQAVNLYLNNSGSVVRPSFGFTYEIVTKAASDALKLPEGARVLEVERTAKSSPLQAGDTITSVDGQAINQDNPLEPLLEKYKPGDTISMQVSRGGEQQTIRLPVAQLK